MQWMQLINTAKNNIEVSTEDAINKLKKQKISRIRWDSGWTNQIWQGKACRRNNRDHEQNIRRTESTYRMENKYTYDIIQERG